MISLVFLNSRPSKLYLNIIYGPGKHCRSSKWLSWCFQLAHWRHIICDPFDAQIEIPTKFWSELVLLYWTNSIGLTLLVLLYWSYYVSLTTLVLLCWSVHWSTGPYAVNPTPAFGQKSKAPLMERFHIELCNEPRPSLILCIKIDQNRSIMNRRTQCKSYIGDIGDIGQTMATDNAEQFQCWAAMLSRSKCSEARNRPQSCDKLEATKTYSGSK